MPLTLSCAAKEEGTYIVIVGFKDEDSAAMTPNSFVWKLTDAYGNVINSRKAVTETASSEVNIVLSGDDLALADPNRPKRVITVTGTYTSSYGTSLPYRDEVDFSVKDLIGI